jgi:hypothetical protein
VITARLLRPPPLRRTALHGACPPRARHPADNRWDTVTRPVRAADLDIRGPAGRSRAIRPSVRAVVARGITDPAVIGLAARSAMLLGDPYRHQMSLFALDEVRRPADPPASNGATP